MTVSLTVFMKDQTFLLNMNCWKKTPFSVTLLLKNQFCRKCSAKPLFSQHFLTTTQIMPIALSCDPKSQNVDNCKIENMNRYKECVPF